MLCNDNDGAKVATNLHTDAPVFVKGEKHIAGCGGGRVGQTVSGGQLMVQPEAVKDIPCPQLATIAECLYLSSLHNFAKLMNCKFSNIHQSTRHYNSAYVIVQLAAHWPSVFVLPFRTGVHMRAFPGTWSEC